jgi:hypothetical protein
MLWAGSAERRIGGRCGDRLRLCSVSALAEASIANRGTFAWAPVGLTPPWGNIKTRNAARIENRVDLAGVGRSVGRKSPTTELGNGTFGSPSSYAERSNGMPFEVN